MADQSWWIDKRKRKHEPKVGSVVVICPGCGQSVMVSIVVDTVELIVEDGKPHLMAAFDKRIVSHECKGQP